MVFPERARARIERLALCVMGRPELGISFCKPRSQPAPVCAEAPVWLSQPPGRQCRDSSQGSAGCPQQQQQVPPGAAPCHPVHRAVSTCEGEAPTLLVRGLSMSGLPFSRVCRPCRARAQGATAARSRDSILLPLEHLGRKRECSDTSQSPQSPGPNPQALCGHGEVRAACERLL